MFDETGDRLCPTHANKNGRRYRYYISQRLVHDAHKRDGGWRLPAKEIEPVVTSALAGFLNDPLRLIECLQIPGASPREINAATQSASAVADHLLHGGSDVQRAHLMALVAHVTIGPTAILIDVRRAALTSLILGRKTQHRGARDEVIQLNIPICLKRRGIEAKLVITDPAQRRRDVDPRLCMLVAEARLWLGQLVSGEFPTVRAIADKHDMHEADVSRALTLAFLAPDIIKSILDGTQPADLTAETLRRLPNLPMDWNAQQRLLGAAR